MNLIKRENFQVCDGAADWRDAIRISTRLLEKNGYIEPRYTDAIIANVETLGPYILLGEHVALPHARPEQGVKEAQIGVTLFRHPVVFPNGEDGQLFVALAAKDNSSHLDAMMEISELLGEEENIQKILTSADAETLYHYFQS